jgi:hypothetical protein
MFEDRVIIITNAIKQLHHPRLAAVDLIKHDQMKIIQNAQTKIPPDEYFHNQAETNYRIITRGPFHKRLNTYFGVSNSKINVPNTKITISNFNK